MVFPTCRDWRSTSGPFLHTPVSCLPEALLGNRFAADRDCGSCLGLGRLDLLQSYCELCLLGSMGLLPQDTGLLVKELIQEDPLYQVATYLASLDQLVDEQASILRE